MKYITLLLMVAVFLIMEACQQHKTDNKNELLPTATSIITTPATTIDSATAAQAYQDYMTPGEFHKMMAKDDGIWEEEMTIWWQPDAPPEKQVATAESYMIMNGLYQVTKHKGYFNGMNFEGMSILGFDNAKQVFVSTWIDNMSSGMMTMEGNYDPDTRSITFKGKSMDIVTKLPTDVREVFKYVNDNMQTMEMYETKEGEKERKTMEIKFTRKS